MRGSGSPAAGHGRRAGSTAYLGFGSNLGDREVYLGAALRDLAGREGLDLIDVSSVWRTDPVGFADQPDFWNLVAQFACDMGPDALLDAALDVEAHLGRNRSFRNAPRTIDIDVLVLGDLRMATPRLTIPHPRLTERGFTLRPLAELAPDLRVPGTGRTVAEFLEETPGLEDGERLFPGRRLLAREEDRA